MSRILPITSKGKTALNHSMPSEHMGRDSTTPVRGLEIRDRTEELDGKL